MIYVKAHRRGDAIVRAYERQEAKTIKKGNKAARISRIRGIINYHLATTKNKSAYAKWANRRTKFNSMFPAGFRP